MDDAMVEWNLKNVLWFIFAMFGIGLPLIGFIIYMSNQPENSYMFFIIGAVCFCCALFFVQKPKKGDE